MKHALGIALLLLASQVHADAVRVTAERLREQALHDPTAWDIVESLVTEIGARARSIGTLQLEGLRAMRLHTRGSGTPLRL